MTSAYSQDQLDAYLERIKIPSCYRRQESPELDLNFLTAIKSHHLCNIPWESVRLHYSTSRDILLEPQDLYEKLIERKHGGYCMEQNCLLTQMLLALGFDAYNVGARAQKRTAEGKPTGNWYGWTHQAIIVKLSEGDRYVVDVGYGGAGAIEPVLLAEDKVTPNIGQQEKRLVKDYQGTRREPDQKLWVYQVRDGKDKPWQSCYCFSEMEFLPQDFRVMSAWTSTDPSSYVTHTLVAMKMLMENGKIYGKLILHGADLRENTGEKTRTIETCKTEAERVGMLEKHFGIVLTEAERNAIVGTPSALPDP